MVRILKSRNNNSIKFVRKLLNDRKLRDRNKIFVAEGHKVVNQLMKSETPLEIYCSNYFFKNLNKSNNFNKSIINHKKQINVIPDLIFHQISKLSNPEGILAIFNQLNHNIEKFLNKETSIGVLCENIQDPTNIGAIIRNCYCLGADALLLTEGTVDIYNPKVVRASAGYITRIPIFYIKKLNIRIFHENNYYMIASHFKSKENCKTIDRLNSLPKKTILVFGNEGKGLSQDVILSADDHFYIPMRDGAESLNVNSSVAIVLHSLIKVK